MGVTTRPEDLVIGNEDLADRDVLMAASPVSHVSANAPPFLHQHGDNDRLVIHDHSVQLHELLLAAGAHSELDRIAGADHCFFGAATDAIMDRVIAFLDAQLGSFADQGR